MLALNYPAFNEICMFLIQVFSMYAIFSVYEIRATFRVRCLCMRSKMLDENRRYTKDFLDSSRILRLVVTRRIFIYPRDLKRVQSST